MAEQSPLREAQERFSAAIPFAVTGTRECSLLEAHGATLRGNVAAPLDMPPYPRAIVEGFLVPAAETEGASEDSPKTFNIVAEVRPGDASCPVPGSGEAIQVATGSLVCDGPVAIVRMWEAQRSGDAISITRPFMPLFFIEEQGADVQTGETVIGSGAELGAWELALLASFGLDRVKVAEMPRVAVFSSGDEVIAHTESLTPGKIRDCNGVMLSAAVVEAGGNPSFKGIKGDDFDGFLSALREALAENDMIVISGGTAVGGRDFVSDLIKEVGDLVVDGVPMRSGRPLIMGISDGKPIVCVAGHPPEALRGFRLFGSAAINRLLGRDVPLPEDG